MFQSLHFAFQMENKVMPTLYRIFNYILPPAVKTLVAVADQEVIEMLKPLVGKTKINN